MVGSQTALADDPSLNVRIGKRPVRTPIRVLLDGRLRVPTSARLLSDDAAARTWVVCRERARGIASVRDAVGRVIEVPSSPTSSAPRHVDLTNAFRRLAEHGLTTVLVEGGGGLAAALLRADLIDEVHWMIAPLLIGSEGRTGLGPLELERLADAVSIDPIRVARRGPDIHIHGLIGDSTSIRSTRTGQSQPKGRTRSAKK